MKRGDLSGIKPDPQKIKKGFKVLPAGLDVNNWIKILAIAIAIFVINYFVASSFWGGQDFFVNWASARMLFFKGINPYSQNGINFLTETSQFLHVIPKDTNYNLLNPLFSIFLFFPFSLFQNFYVARAFWLIINEAFLFISCRLVLRIVGLKDDQQVTVKLLVYFFSFFYSVIALLQGSEYIFLFFIFLGALRWIQEKKLLGTGFLLAILTFKMQAVIIPLLVLFVYLFFEKGWSAFVWFLISLAVLGVASYLLVPDWPIMYFRAIVTNGVASGIALPGELVKNWINDSPPLIWNGISVICFGIILLELFLSPIDSKRLFWVLCLAISLHPLIMIQNRLGSLCFLLLPMGFIFYQWMERNRLYGSWVINISLIIFSFFLITLGFLTKSMDYKEPFPAVFYFLPIAFTLLNLYWIRGWVKNNLPVF